MASMRVLPSASRCQTQSRAALVQRIAGAVGAHQDRGRVSRADVDQAAGLGAGALQPDGRRIPEPLMDLSSVARSILHMASLPLEANVQFMTVMATSMPYIGRG